MDIRALIIGLSAAAFVAGCATAPPPQVSAGSPIVPASYSPPPSSAPLETGSTGNAATYQLTDEEKALSCKKLSGRITLRSLELRDYAAKPKTSELSRAMQSLLSPLMSGAKTDSGEAGRHIRDQAIIDAYKRRLAELKCPPLEIADTAQGPASRRPSVE